jgi:hypothetical protein
MLAGKPRSAYMALFYGTFHSVVITFSFFVGNFLVIGINPFTYMKKRREIENRYIDKDADMKLLESILSYMNNSKDGSK